jgi:cell division protein FtsB
MYKTVCLLIIALIAFLSFKLINSNNNLAKTTNVYNEIKQQKQILANMQQENAKLLKDIKVLREYPLSIEERARLDLGLVKPNEQFYQVVTTKK